MGFFDSKTLPDSKGKESFFGSYNIPVNIPTPEPKQSTSSKVGGVVKAVAKDLYGTAATIPVRAAQAEELLRTSFFGGADSQKKAQEFASQPVDIGFGTQVKPLDTSSIGRAAQQTAGDIIKTASLTNIGGRLTLAKQAALQGGTYGLGNAMEEGKSAVDTIKDTAVGTILGWAGGKALSVIGGAKTASQLAKKTDAQITEEALARANFGPIPEASNPRLALPAPRKPSEIPIELPSPGILQSQQKIREVYTPSVPAKQNSPLHEEASKFNVRDDFVNSQIKKEIKVETNVPKSNQAKRATQKPLNEFIKNEIDFLERTQQKVPKGYTEKLTKVWEVANKPAKVITPPKTRSAELAKIWNESKDVATPKKVNVPKSEIPTKEVPAAATQEVPVSVVVPEVTPPKVEPATNVAPVTPKPVSYTKDPVQSLTKVMETELPPNTDPTFIGTTLADQTAKYDAAASVIPTDDLIDMAMGLKPSPAGLNPVSIHTLTSIRKDLTVEQAMRLKNIYPLSQAGQDLSLARLKSGAIIDNPVDMMQAVEKELKQQVVKKGINKTDIKNLFPDCGFN